MLSLSVLRQQMQMSVLLIRCTVLRLPHDGWGGKNPAACGDVSFPPCNPLRGLHGLGHAILFRDKRFCHYMLATLLLSMNAVYY